MARKKSKSSKKDTQILRKKNKYRIRNGREYNRSLVNRGSITFWFMGALEGIPLGDVLGDGAYDTVDCRDVIHDQGGKQVIPPKRTAKKQKRQPIPSLKERDAAIDRIKEIGNEGRAHWKKEVGYHRRSRVETFMFRYKTILGDRLAARKDWTQFTEVKIKLDVLNRMTKLGMPKSVIVAA